jgi:Tfp pilus assembly protein PilV
MRILRTIRALWLLRAAWQDQRASERLRLRAQSRADLARALFETNRASRTIGA